jgi:hypothetical protein
VVSPTVLDQVFNLIGHLAIPLARPGGRLRDVDQQARPRFRGLL